MTSPGFAAIKIPSASSLMLIVPVKGQKVKCVSPSPLEILLRSREQEPTGSTDRTTITARLRHDLDTSLQELQTRLMIPDIDQLILGLVSYRHRHNIQTGGYYLSVAISARPTHGLFAPAECLLLNNLFD